MNTTELISSIKMKGGFPDDNYFSTDDFLVFLNDQLKLDIIPLLMKLNEEYFLTDKEYSISSSATYRIPKRAIGAKLRDVKLKDSSGAYTNLTRLFEEDKASNPSGYYLRKNVVELSSDLNTLTSSTLVLTYFAAPNTLVATSKCGQIQSIDTVLNLVVINATPTTFVNGVSVDFIQNNNPYDTLLVDAAISNVSGTTITFSTLPDGLIVNDWIALAGQSPVLSTVPEEVHPILIQSTLCACLSARKDKSAEFEAQKLAQMKESATNLLEPRVESNDVKMRGTGLLGFFRNR